MRPDGPPIVRSNRQFFEDGYSLSGMKEYPPCECPQAPACRPVQNNVH
ncbi:hypothetical protein F4556_007308 [Kitasatospora gansuensis]|uniref:Uncharacterized protein n=1 Tax=Kitasatospora gansuensis TaxID=258050 RepID=A0A7W7SKX3_9ACTN|nr:hypothetical protein [Kitasatospora gansuensis]MBB4951773.1 hypothetical protein [Kitasatospora gansuensis]